MVEAFDALRAWRFAKCWLALVGRWIRASGTIASRTGLDELLTISTCQENGTPTFAGVVGAVKEMLRMDDKGTVFGSPKGGEVGML